VSFAAINLCVAPQRVFTLVVYVIIDLARKHLDNPRIPVFRRTILPPSSE
jgi:hypothetical protein